MEYMMIAVKKETKEMLEDMKEEYQAKTYDELINKMAGRSILEYFEKFRGRGAGLPPFVRDKRDRIFD